MEKSLTADERIRRAEEIYYKRKLKQYDNKTATVNVGELKRGLKLFDKMVIQILVCSLIYSAFYFVTRANYIFSENVTSKAKQILEYDINLQELFSNIEGLVDKALNNNDVEIVDNIEQKEENIENNIEAETETVIEEPQVELTQEEKDVQEILAEYSFINPLSSSVVTSEFGERESENPQVTPNHTGIDLGEYLGTTIIASMEGIVTQVSSEGDYGKHIRIENNDVTTLYAHCNEILVNEGDYIMQGQEIATVGETGNATGPHLHFEIRKEDRYINPRLIINF